MDQLLPCFHEFLEPLRKGLIAVWQFTTKLVDVSTKTVDLRTTGEREEGEGGRNKIRERKKGGRERSHKMIDLKKLIKFGGGASISF